MRFLSTFTPADITGFCFARRVDDPSQPHLYELPGAPDRWVPIFSTEEKLQEGMRHLGVSQYTVSRITDGPEFVGSVHEGGVRVALDPRPDPARGVTRWTEILPAEQG